MNYDDQLKAYRTLAAKCRVEIMRTVDIEIGNSISKSWKENNFLNLNVWVSSIRHNLDTLKLVDNLSTEAYRKRERLDK